MAAANERDRQGQPSSTPRNEDSRKLDLFGCKIYLQLASSFKLPTNRLCWEGTTLISGTPGSLRHCRRSTPRILPPSGRRARQWPERRCSWCWMQVIQRQGLWPQLCSCSTVHGYNHLNCPRKSSSPFRISLLLAWHFSQTKWMPGCMA